jgi:hypothetical protein
MSVWIDGVDTSTLGVLTSDIPELRDGPDVDHPTMVIPGRAGAVHISKDGEGQEGERRINWIAALARADHHTVLERLDELKWRILRREVEIRIVDRFDRFILGRIEAPRGGTIPPAFTQRMIYVRWTFRCADPQFYEVDETTVDINAGPADCPVGTGDIAPTIDVIGPIENPEFIHRNASGDEVGRLKLIVSAGAGEHLQIDNDTPMITLDAVEIPATLVGTTDFLLLRHIYAGGLSGPHQTTELLPSGTAASAKITYRKPWRGV